MNCIVLLNFATAITALAAAFFWLRSAMTTIPEPTSPYGAPDLKPYEAIKKAAVRSMWAAGFAGISAILGAVSAIFSAITYS